MCVDKTRDAPQTSVTNVTVALTSTVVEIFKANPRRRLLVLCAPAGTDQLFVGFSGISSNEQHLVLRGGQPNMVLSVSDWGTVIQGGIWANSSPGITFHGLEVTDQEPDDIPYLRATQPETQIFRGSAGAGQKTVIGKMNGY